MPTDIAPTTPQPPQYSADEEFGAALATTPMSPAVEQPQELPGPTLLSIPDDVTARVEQIDQAAEAALQAMTWAQLREAGLPRKEAGQTDSQYKEVVRQHNERVKEEFTAQVLEARRQAAAPPPPPQPVPTAISEQTKREMAAGAKQSAYWAEQQKSRPTPSARDIAAAGHTTPVFQPASYTHEKGVGVKGKDYTAQNTPSR